MLINSIGIGTITLKKPLDLKECYKLVIKSIDIDGSKLYVELFKDNIVVNSQVIELAPYSIENACNAYCYEVDLMDSTGAIIQHNFPIIAVHFKNAFRGENVFVANIDGIWQISENPRQICNSGICPVGASCNNGQCACPQGLIGCNEKCIPMDNYNCGQCGILCTSGQTCCDGKCIDTSGDANNCGGCDRICSTCGSCNNGACTIIGEHISVNQTSPNPANKIYSTIQNAIDNANDCSIIDVSEGTYPENLAVTDKSLVIRGAGTDKTIIDGMRLGSAIDLGQNSRGAISVTIADMTIQNGTNGGNGYIGGTGGGINIGPECSATVKICTIIKNHGIYGGGINIYGSLAVKVIGCNISSNIADDNGGGILDGANDGDVTVTDSKINNNCAIYGGGIEDDGFNLKVQNSIISYNNNYGIYWGDAGQPIIENSQITNNNPDNVYPPIW